MFIKLYNFLFGTSYISEEALEDKARSMNITNRSLIGKSDKYNSLYCEESTNGKIVFFRYFNGKLQETCSCWRGSIDVENEKNYLLRKVYANY